MIRSPGLSWMVFGGSLLVGCTGGGGGAPCVLAGTSIAVARTTPAGACPAPVVAGVATLNGVETFMPMKDLACGVDHFNLTVTFIAQDANHATCTGTDTIMFPDFTPTGGSGTDSMAITCTDNTTCTETFDVSFTPM